MTDFHVQDHGSIIILEPQTTVAKDWIADHLQEDACGWPSGHVIERCYFKPVYAGIIRDGLTIS
jgi:hypothetical protein